MGILQQLKLYDTDGSGTISHEELMVVLDSAEAREVLQDMSIDVEYLHDFSDLLFSLEDGDNEMAIGKAMELILLCRGDQPATVSSIATAHRLAHANIEQALQWQAKDFKRILAECIGRKGVSMSAQSP